jgi:hypothetical protein
MTCATTTKLMPQSQAYVELSFGDTLSTIHPLGMDGASQAGTNDASIKDQ